MKRKSLHVCRPMGMQHLHCISCCQCSLLTQQQRGKPRGAPLCCAARVELRLASTEQLGSCQAGRCLPVDSIDKLGRAVSQNTGEKTSALEDTERLREAAAKGQAAGSPSKEDHSKKPPELVKERTKPFEIGI